MLQYLLNATSIWLISLLSYDIFLRRESYHSYNRFYLLFTFLLGALLPMLQWQGGNILPPATQRSVEQVIIVKQSIVTASVLPATQYNWQQWIAAAYAIGALVALCLCAVEIIKLISYARSGIKTTQGRWTIIETGKEHTPFSLRNTLFVGSLHQYGAAEWQMILSHESRHSSLLHLADLILLQIAKVIFWFHPLVYVYNKRLLLVHEYQADSVAAPQPQQYGRFLVEQALLQSAPSVAHSFNRSPIKNRIVMLTRRSTALAKGKMLVFVPVLISCLLLFSKNSFSQKGKGNGNHTTVAVFGSNNKTDVAHFTYEQILKDPFITCTEADGEVTGYTISFLPKGKDFYGPFKVNGSNKLQPNTIAFFKGLQDSSIANTRIFVENIIVKRNGKEEAPQTMILLGTLK